MTFRLTIYDSPELPGLYAWELTDGPNGTITESGIAPTISRCLTEIAAARLAIERHFAGHRDPGPSAPADNPTSPSPVAHLQTPHGAALPAQQDIPTVSHTPTSSTFFYPHPSKSG